jgi:hypothetical protein
MGPLRCYVGELVDENDHGIRITLMDWVIGSPGGFDLFIPRESIALVLTNSSPEYPKDEAADEIADKQFIEYAKRWQTECNALEK